jgi:hypothetical protein
MKPLNLRKGFPLPNPRHSSMEFWMQPPSPSKRTSYARRNFVALTVFYKLRTRAWWRPKRRPHMNFGKMVRRSFLAVALGSMFAIGGLAQPASAAPRYAMHSEVRNGRREMRRDVRMRNRMNRRIRRNFRQLRRSNREFGRNSLRSRMIRRRIRRDFRQRYAMNRDLRHDRRDGRRDRNVG